MRTTGHESFRTTILFCLVLLLGASVLLLRNNIPAQQRNRALLEQFENMREQKRELEERLDEFKRRHHALRYDPIAIQREALLQQGFTPSENDVIVR